MISSGSWALNDAMMIDARNVTSTKCHVQPFSMINIFIVYTNKLAIQMASFEGKDERKKKTWKNDFNKKYYSSTSRPLNDAIIISYIFISIRNENVLFIFATYIQRDTYISFPSTLFLHKSGHDKKNKSISHNEMTFNRKMNPWALSTVTNMAFCWLY